MTGYQWLAVHDAAGFAAGAYLAVNDSPWWAALCFFLVATASVKTTATTRKGEDE